MKKLTKRLMILCLVLAMLFCLVGCGGVDGKYVCKISGRTFTELTFDDGSVVKYQPTTGKTTHGTYTLEDGILQIDWENDKYDEYTYDEDSDSFSHTVLPEFVWCKEE